MPCPIPTARSFTDLEVECLQSRFLLKADGSDAWGRVTGSYVWTGKASIRGRCLELTSIDSLWWVYEPVRRLLDRDSLCKDWLVLTGRGHDAADFLWRTRVNRSWPRLVRRRTRQAEAVLARLVERGPRPPMTSVNTGNRQTKHRLPIEPS